MLRLAIQKSGRLADQSSALIRESGISFERHEARLRSVAENFPVELLFVRDDDIPRYVSDGVVDLGIVGENLLGESGLEVEILQKLGFSRCRLSIAVPKGSNYTSVTDLNGINIATCYPRTLEAFLLQEGVKAEIHEVSGSVELTPSIGLAEAICDLVSTGSTLMSNGLREMAVVMHSQAVLVANKRALQSKQAEIEALAFRIRSVLKARENKYILLNAPNEAIDKISSILPGLKSPTVMPLAEQGWSSLHSVITENDFWSVIEDLKKAGAQGILVIPIEKMIV